ncbi:MAG: sigma-70 family RNA polymerase sigma factor [Rhodothermales bacterium]
MFERLRRRFGRRPKRRSNAEWVRDLAAADSHAITDLRAELLRGVRIVLRRRAPAKAEDLAEDFVQEAVLKILDSLDSFRGDSRFMTWAQTIVVRVAFTELRRKRWENVSLDGLVDERPFEGLDAAGDAAVSETLSERNAAGLLRELMQSELTEKQRTAIEAVMLHGMPIDEVARRMDSNRNALYKLLHDARKRLKEGFEARGLTLEQLLDD